MEPIRRILKSTFFILAAFCATSHRLAIAADAAQEVKPAEPLSSNRNLPLVFDPKSRKYFIGGSAKFVLKEEKNSLIDRIEVSIDGKDYIPYGTAIQFKEEGKHTLKFRAVNSVNNWSPVQFIEVFVDLTSPTTEAKFSGEQFFTDNTGLYAALNSSLTLVAQDNLSGVANIEYSWDGSNFKPYSTPITIEKPGKQTLYFRSMDKVGNIEATHALNFQADGTSPNSVLKLQGKTRPITVGGKNYVSVSDSVAFAIEAGDDASKVKQVWVSLDEASFTPYIKPIYFLQEGPHSMKYYSEDNVGNKEEPKAIAIYTVSVPPKTTATTVGKVVNTGGINFATREFMLKLEASENIAGLDRIEIKLDTDADFRPYIEPVTFKSPGLHTINYRAVDRAGNIEPAKTYTVHVYETAPETTIATAQPLVVREGVSYSPAPNIMTFNVSNSSVGVAQTFVSINDSPFNPYTGPITLTTDHKVYKIMFKSVDRLGNEERPKTSNFHMIGTIPIVDLFVSSGQSQEEQVRTNYFDHPNGTPPAQNGMGNGDAASTSSAASSSDTATTARAVSSEPTSKKGSKKGASRSLPRADELLNSDTATAPNVDRSPGGASMGGTTPGGTTNGGTNNALDAPPLLDEPAAGGAPRDPAANPQP